MSAPKPLDVFQCPLQGVRLIEASAGTGKTWNICALYLRLLLERGLTVQQILVVTFTNAATAELRERIRSRIAEALATLEDPELRKRLVRALRTFDEAAIFTIHGFCKRALDDAPFAAGLPLVQELLEDDSELRQQVANDFWRKHVSGAHLQSALASWLLAKKKDDPGRWAQVLKRHAGKPLSRVLWPDGSEAAPDLEVPQDFVAAFNRARDLWLAERDDIVACVKEAIPRLKYYKEEHVDAAVAQWDAVFMVDDPAAWVRARGKMDFLAQQKMQPKKGQAACRDHEFFALAQQLLDGWDVREELLEQARWNLLRRLVEGGPAQLRELKRSRRVVAFDDMLVNLHDRLVATDGGSLAATLRHRFPAALIDEFQDTDPLQFSIFERIYAADADSLLVLVGDPKQAIYSFRNADLHTYLLARDKAQERYTLLENQRSTPELIGALNALFTVNRQGFLLEGLEYQEVQPGSKPRKPFEDRTAYRAALHLWSLPGPPRKKQETRDLAVRACAAEIARLLGAAQRGEVLHDGEPLGAGDIAVLVRSHNEGSQVRQALLALGVGSVELRQTSVFRTPDAQELETLLLAVAQPQREPLMRAALATEMLGMDAVAIEQLSNDESLLAAAMQRFADYRSVWLHRGVAPMLRELVANEGVHARLLARDDGERRLTNLRHLSELLHEAAQEHPGVDALLRWLQARRRAAEASDATQVRLESDRNLVQIVTIHKSKGLEYPVVFCPFLWDGHPGKGGILPGFEYHDADGTPVVNYREVKKGDAVWQQVKLEKEAERVRLAYVALTRAVHRCYVVVGDYLTRGSLEESAQNPFNRLVHGGWVALARRNEPAVALEPLPEAAGRAVDLPQPLPESIAARVPPKAVPYGWRIASYSSLAHGVRRETAEAAADRDLHAAEAGPATDAATAEDDILRFPRGARAGECLHKVFEEAEFDYPLSWNDTIANVLRTKPPATGADAKVLAPMVHRMLADVTATALPGGLRLATIGRERRLSELEFNLSTPSLDTSRIAAVLKRHGHADLQLRWQALQGYLRGFIDLVFEHDGRFHILDWKSNYLGASAQDYAGPRLQRAMEAEGYHLQYLLYAVAVHRWLKRRKPGYDYEQHFGSVYYLFVRGVRPGWRNAGVFHARPSLALVQGLDEVLG